MSEIVYVVTVRGFVPDDLPRKVIEAHVKALQFKHFSEPRYGKDITKSKPAAKKKKTIGA